MNDILYEVSFKFNLALLMPVFMLVFITLFPTMLKKYCNGKKVQINFKYAKLFCEVAFSFIFLISVIVIVSQAHMYNRTIGQYKKGNYEIVEGYVENFIPMPYEGHGEESFEINGVSFSYSDYSVQPGYSNAKSHGGVITGNGQHLKIGYIHYNDTYGNIIVYIEQLS